MYLALRPPWAGRGTATIDAGAIAQQVVTDGGVGKKVGKKRVVRRRPAGPSGAVVAGDDPSWTAGGDDGAGDELPPRVVPLSAAERALEWRGDDTTKPAQKLDMAGGGDARPLDDGEIQAVIASQSAATQKCIVDAATNTDLRGKITVRMIVDGNGRVTRSKLEAPRYLFERGLLGCVQRAVKAMKFPATGMATLVTMPINLT